MADEIEHEYLSSLSDLTVNSKPLINMLTVLAEENRAHAPTIVKTIEKHLSMTEYRLPVLYLIDSIVKNVGKQYVILFMQNIVSTFTGVFVKVDEKTRLSMWRLRHTWGPVFTPKKLHAIDVRVNSIDPAWPVHSPSSSASSGPPAAAAPSDKSQPAASTPSKSIHINPKIFNKKEAVASLPPVSDPMEEIVAAKIELLTLQVQTVELALMQGSSEAEKIAKTKELLDLRTQKAKLELQQATSKLKAKAALLPSASSVSAAINTAAPTQLESSAVEVSAVDRKKPPSRHAVGTRPTRPKGKPVIRPASVTSADPRRAVSRTSTTPQPAPTDPRLRPADPRLKPQPSAGGAASLTSSLSAKPSAQRTAAVGADGHGPPSTPSGTPQPPSPPAISPSGQSLKESDDRQPEPALLKTAPPPPVIRDKMKQTAPTGGQRADSNRSGYRDNSQLSVRSKRQSSPLSMSRTVQQHDTSHSGRRHSPPTRVRRLPSPPAARPRGNAGVSVRTFSPFGTVDLIVSDNDEEEDEVFVIPSRASNDFDSAAGRRNNRHSGEKRSSPSSGSSHLERSSRTDSTRHASNKHSSPQRPENKRATSPRSEPKRTSPSHSEHQNTQERTSPLRSELNQTSPSCSESRQVSFTRQGSKRIPFKSDSKRSSPTTADAKHSSPTTADAKHSSPSRAGKRKIPSNDDSKVLCAEDTHHASRSDSRTSSDNVASSDRDTVLPARSNKPEEKVSPKSSLSADKNKCSRKTKQDVTSSKGKDSGSKKSPKDAPKHNDSPKRKRSEPLKASSSPKAPVNSRQDSPKLKQNNSSSKPTDSRTKKNSPNNINIETTAPSSNSAEKPQRRRSLISALGDGLEDISSSSEEEEPLESTQFRRSKPVVGRRFKKHKTWSMSPEPKEAAPALLPTPGASKDVDLRRLPDVSVALPQPALAVEPKSLEDPATHPAKKPRVSDDAVLEEKESVGDVDLRPTLNQKRPLPTPDDALPPSKKSGFHDLFGSEDTDLRFVEPISGGTAGWRQLKQEQPDQFKSPLRARPLLPQHAAAGKDVDMRVSLATSPGAAVGQLSPCARPLSRSSSVGQPANPLDLDEELRLMEESSELTQKSINMILKQAEEQVRSEEITWEQYNNILSQVIRLDERQKIREHKTLERRKSMSGSRNQSECSSAWPVSAERGPSTVAAAGNIDSPRPWDEPTSAAAGGGGGGGHWRRESNPVTPPRIPAAHPSRAPAPQPPAGRFSDPRLPFRPADYHEPQREFRGGAGGCYPAPMRGRRPAMTPGGFDPPRGRGRGRGAAVRPTTGPPEFVPDPELPDPTPEMVAAAERDRLDRASTFINEEFKDVLWYGENCICLVDWDDPRMLYFQPGARAIHVDNQTVVCRFNDKYSELVLDGIPHSVRLGGPTREVFIDGHGFQAYFGSEAMPVMVEGHKRMLSVDGPPPGVEIGRRRTDLLGGKIKLIIDGSEIVDVYLDCKWQTFVVDGKLHVLRFRHGFDSMEINGVTMRTEFGSGLPLPLVVRGRRHYIRLSRVPDKLMPGRMSMKGMSPERGPWPAPWLDPDMIKMVRSVDGFTKSGEHRGSRSHPRPAASEHRGRSKVDSSVLPSAISKPAGPSYTAENPGVALAPGAAGLNLNDLLNRLVKTGLIAGSSAADKKEEEIKSIKEINWKIDSLKARQPGVINRLYTGIQCSSCGMRFLPEQTVQYSNHLDWHFRQNRREQGVGAALSRRWYYDLEGWMLFEEVADPDEKGEPDFDRPGETAEAVKEDEDIESMCSAAVGETDDDNQCQVCHEMLVKFYHEEYEEWHLRDCIRVEGKAYHPSCFEDHKTSLLLQSLRHDSTDASLAADDTTDVGEEQEGAAGDVKPESVDTAVTEVEMEVKPAVEAKSELAESSSEVPVDVKEKANTGDVVESARDEVVSVKLEAMIVNDAAVESGVVTAPESTLMKPDLDVVELDVQMDPASPAVPTPVESHSDSPEVVFVAAKPCIGRTAAACRSVKAETTASPALTDRVLSSTPGQSDDATDRSEENGLDGVLSSTSSRADSGLTIEPESSQDQQDPQEPPPADSEVAVELEDSQDQSELKESAPADSEDSQRVDSGLAAESEDSQRVDSGLAAEPESAMDATSVLGPLNDTREHTALMDATSVPGSLNDTREHTALMDATSVPGSLNDTREHTALMDAQPPSTDETVQQPATETSESLPQTPPQVPVSQTPPQVTEHQTPPQVTEPHSPPQVTGPQTPPQIARSQTPPQVTRPQTPPQVTRTQTPPQVTRPQTPPQIIGSQTPPQTQLQVTEPLTPPKIAGSQTPPQITEPQSLPQALGPQSPIDPATDELQCTDAPSQSAPPVDSEQQTPHPSSRLVAAVDSVDPMAGAITETSITDPCSPSAENTSGLTPVRDEISTEDDAILLQQTLLADVVAEAQEASSPTESRMSAAVPVEKLVEAPVREVLPESSAKTVEKPVEVRVPAVSAIRSMDGEIVTPTDSRPRVPGKIRLNLAGVKAQALDEGPSYLERPEPASVKSGLIGQQVTQQPVKNIGLEESAFCVIM